MRGRRARRIGLGAVIAIAAAAVYVATWTPTDHRTFRPGPGTSGPPSDTPPGVGPIVYYEVLDAEGSRLMERRLDGRSLARQVAERTDVDYGRTWTVDPTGSMAIATIPGPDDQGLEAISIATGASLWSARTPTAPADGAVWSADGQHLALTSIGTDSGPRETLVLDARTGRFLRLTIPDDAIVQGFELDGTLILRQHIPSPQGVTVGWRFLGVDPATATIQPLTSLPDVGPASDWSEDVDPAAGLAVDSTLGPNDTGTAIRLWTLRGGSSRTLATVSSADKIVIDPGGTGVAISAAQTIRFVAFDGRAADIFTGPDPIADFSWSVAGDYLAVATDRRGPNLTIVERATGRSVELPHGDAVAQLLLVRMVGGVPLPPAPLPAVEPTPSPTAGPSGADVAGFGGILSGWVDRSGDTQVAHVERLVPTQVGGLRIAAAMPPLDLGPAAVPDDGGPTLQLLPRPGSNDVLVWIGTSDRSSGWLWDAVDGLRALPLPTDWPDNAFDVAWRPDGLAIAATAGRSTVEGGFEDVFVVAALTGRRTTVVPIVGDYDRLEGWWSPTELRVGHGICTEGCSGRYAYDARLQIRTHRVVQMTPADRAHGPIDEALVGGGSIVLSMINGDRSDDIVIDWPTELGSRDTLDPLGLAGDGRSLLVARTTATGTDLDRIADPIGRAVGGHVADAQPTLLLHLDGRTLRIDVSPDVQWATVVDRVDNVRLVRLSDGRSWPVDRERVLVWPDGP
ncbi:MAG TPA: hypothetical protein VHM48_02405 [Candidatus Limnocylindrales bacterium]|nr:hypothetical protein [Candidatus Limnocylindrales bacterium]